jgi:hypothetical protein
MPQKFVGLVVFSSALACADPRDPPKSAEISRPAETSPGVPFARAACGFQTLVPNGGFDAGIWVEEADEALGGRRGSAPRGTWVSEDAEGCSTSGAWSSSGRTGDSDLFPVESGRLYQFGASFRHDSNADVERVAAECVLYWCSRPDCLGSSGVSRVDTISSRFVSMRWRQMGGYFRSPSDATHASVECRGFVEHTLFDNIVVLPE